MIDYREQLEGCHGDQQDAGKEKKHCIIHYYNVKINKFIFLFFIRVLQCTGGVITGTANSALYREV